MKFYLLLSLLLLPIANSFAEQPEGDYPSAEAQESIRRGIVKSSFALALNLIEARKNRLQCDFDATQDRIANVVAGISSVATPEEMQNFSTDFSKDADIWKNMTFKMAVANQRWALSAEEIKKYLIGSLFWGPARGAYGPMNTVELFDGNKARVGTLELTEAAPWSKWNYSEIDWELTTGPEGEFLLRVGTKNYLYKDDGASIKFEPTKKTEDDLNDTLFTAPSECDA